MTVHLLTLIAWLAAAPATQPASMPAGVSAPFPDDPACAPDVVASLRAAVGEHPVNAVGEARAEALRGEGRASAGFADPSLFVEARGLPVTEPWNIGRTPMGGLAAGASGKLPWIPRLWANAEAKDHQAAATELMVGEQRLDLVQQLLLVLVEREALQGRMRVMTQRVALLRSLSDVARANAVVGKGGQSDAVLLEARAARAEADIEALRQRADALRGQWQAVLGADQDMPRCRLPSFREDRAGDDDLRRRPVMQALDAKRSAADAARRAALHSWVPEPTLKAGYVWRADYGNFDGIDFVGGMLQVPLPLSLDTRLGKQEAASAQSRAAQAEQEAFLRRARGQRQMLLDQIGAEQARIDELTAHARPVAEAASQVAQAAYRVGEGRVASVIEAERLVLDIDQSLVTSRAQKARLEVRLWRLLGAPPTKSE